RARARRRPPRHRRAELAGRPARGAGPARPRPRARPRPLARRSVHRRGGGGVRARRHQRVPRAAGRLAARGGDPVPPARPGADPAAAGRRADPAPAHPPRGHPARPVSPTEQSRTAAAIRTSAIDTYRLKDRPRGPDMARRGAALRTAVPALVAATALGLTACGGGSAGGGSGEVTSLRVLDYYDNDPDRGVYERKLNECGQQAGVTIEREAVPGEQLIPRVLQQASSRTLPDVLMIDNPDLQQIASTGALAPISQFGLSADGYQEGVRDASTFEGEVYGLQPVTNSIGLFYNVDILDEAGITPPTTWDELKAAAAALTDGDRYGIAFSAVADYEGAWQFLP